MTRYTVALSDDAFRVAVMAALEAYCVPHGCNKSVNAHTPLETTGAIWGTTKTDAFGNLIYQVESVDVDTSAEMQTAAVAQKPAAIALKTSFTEKFTPHFQYLGDFHSHPYSEGEIVAGKKLGTPQHAEQSKVYRFSGTPSPATSDYGSVAAMRTMGLEYRVGLVVTLFRMRYAVSHPRKAYLDERSAIRLTFNGTGLHGQKETFRIWVKAHVFPDPSQAIPVPDQDVILLCPIAGFFG
ncbi:hypothetical protein HUU62_04850 [Rhodoferax sp. 4810]|nr:hypothetical protein [Rhodoferax jenense]